MYLFCQQVEKENKRCLDSQVYLFSLNKNISVLYQCFISVSYQASSCHCRYALKEKKCVQTNLHGKVNKI